MNLLQMDRYGVPRYIRRNGMLYRLPRGYRKYLTRKALHASYGILFKITYEMWKDDAINHARDMWL